MRDIATRQMGLAPDARGKMHPPEIVYWTEERKRRRYVLSLISTLAFGVGLMGFLPTADSWQMPFWLAVLLTSVGGIGICVGALTSARSNTD